MGNARPSSKRRIDRNVRSVGSVAFRAIAILAVAGTLSTGASATVRAEPAYCQTMKSNKIDFAKPLNKQLKPLRNGVPASIKTSIEKMISLSEKIEKGQKGLKGHPEKLAAQLKLSEEYGKAADVWIAWGQSNCTSKSENSPA